jgi:hypothetical protein
MQRWKGQTHAALVILTGIVSSGPGPEGRAQLTIFDAHASDGKVLIGGGNLVGSHHDV